MVKLTMEPVTRIEAVSYTHLDVYKRQELNSMTGMVFQHYCLLWIM